MLEFVRIKETSLDQYDKELDKEDNEKIASRANCRSTWTQFKVFYEIIKE
jgi:hypothetical protein